MWQLEWDCCQLLQTAGRPLDSWELLAGVAAHVPPQLGRPISGERPAAARARCMG